MISLTKKGENRTVKWKNIGLLYRSDESNSYVVFGKLRQPVFLMIDAFLVTMALFLSFELRFDMEIPALYIDTLLRILPLAIATKISVFYFFGFYNQLWKYASLKELARLLQGITVSSAVFLVALYFAQHVEIPRVVYVIDWLLTLSLVGGSYLMIRARKDLFPTFNFLIGHVDQKRVFIVGAGEAGSILVKQMQQNRHMGYKPVAILDDDRSKAGLMIHGVEVIGTTKITAKMVAEFEVEEVILAIPAASPKDKRRIAINCREVGILCKTVPDFSELVRNGEGVLHIRNIEPKEVLGREEVEIDLRDIVGCYAQRVVLITGAAGSIGSEICRQIVDLNPARIIATDIYENGLYHIEEEIRGYLKDKSDIFEIQIMDIRDDQAIERVFVKYKPDIVFHAAAYKHVPMMEKHPIEVIKNNSLGTLQIIKAVQNHKCERFIFISTDKAVNPTSIMGLSKQFGEKAIRLAAENGSDTKFMAVRFGNVLGSNGSVVPKFNRQIKNGEPITITHKDITRYFMTIQEAVFLVTQATAIGEGGEIFVLDMGEPVRILDMAKNMVRLAGFEPEEDIPIVITGLRPGEKLYEELFNSDEKVAETVHPQINLAFGSFDKKAVELQFKKLITFVDSGNELALIDFLHHYCSVKDNNPAFKRPKKRSS